MLRAKTVLQDKFWLIETNDGIKKGTITNHDTSVIVVLDKMPKRYSSLEEACKELNMSISEVEVEEVKETLEESVSGFPTKGEAFNPTWDIKKKIPVFTKTEKSRTLHAAGYYVINFDTGWVQSFCPKVSTLDSNEFRGPFKDKLEMRSQLRKMQNASYID